MRQFTIAQTPADPKRDSCWYVEIDGRRDRQYSSQWAAIVGAFVAAHEATHAGDEAMIVMETSARQVWTVSLTPEVHGEAFNPMAPSGYDQRLRGAA
jgi:hypothetical protein